MISYKARDNDIVDSRDELNQSIANNLNIFLNSLAGKLIYKISLVSSVTLQDGTVQTGKAQTVKIGTNKNGTAKTKTIVSKFAVMDVYILLPGQTEKKITRLLLAPVNTLNYNPKTEELNDVAQNIRKTIVLPQATPETAPTNPTTSEPTPSIPVPEVPQIPQIAVAQRDYFVNYDSFYTNVMYISGDKIVVSPDFSSLLTQAEKQTFANYGEQTKEGIARLLKKGVDVSQYRHKIFANEIAGRIAPTIQKNTFEEFFAPDGGAVAPAPTPASTTPGSATTLSAYFAAQGLPLPTIAARGVMYEQFGLGSSSLYVGTAEQNTALLSKLKAKAPTVLPTTPSVPIASSTVIFEAQKHTPAILSFPVSVLNFIHNLFFEHE